MTSPFKPSPLGFSSPARSSPFRRPEPSSTSSTTATTSGIATPQNQTPSSSPIKQSTISPRVLNSPFHIVKTTTETTTSTPRPKSSHNITTSPGGLYSPFGTPQSTGAPGSPLQQIRPGRLGSFGSVLNSPADSTTSQTTAIMTRKAANAVSNANALSQLQPAQVRTLREGFQILDRDSDGFVNREDVADMLNQLGLPATPSDVAAFFPSSSPQTMSMAIFINTLASALAAMSSSTELLSAFSAFDDDDSGQVDLVELKDALLNTVPEPGERPLTESEIDQVINGYTARRAFSKKSMASVGLSGMGKRGEVFKYQDFINNVMSSGPAAPVPDEEE